MKTVNQLNKCKRLTQVKLVKSIYFKSKHRESICINFCHRFREKLVYLK